MGDRPSFDALAERFAGPLLAFVLVRVGDRHDAEEVVQEAFLRAWRAIGRFDQRRRFSTWLYTIARNEAVSLTRSKRRHEAPATEPIAPGPTPRPGRGVWSLAAAVLGPDEYECVWLRYADGRTAREIAAITGRSGVGVRVLLHRARARLREALEREGD
jgi:RNA polymerase sigma-70 factor (ECF subfamily)